MKRFLCAFFVIASPAFGNECINYKIRPKITVAAPGWVKHVVQPVKPMDLWHGNVIATLVDNYDIAADVTPVGDGVCIWLKSVNATIGYSDFLVQIDMRHKVGTCEYDAVLGHEDEHIRAYLSIIDDAAADLHAAVYSAADSVMPIFVKDKENIDAAIDEFNKSLQNHPELVLVKQKILAAEEIKNKRVDENDDGSNLRQCGQ